MFASVSPIEKLEGGDLVTKNEPLQYCVRCGNMVPGNKMGEGQHTKWDEKTQTMVPCK